MSATLTEVTINVTQEHIDRGKAGDCMRCPIALGIVASLPGAVAADVAYMFDAVTVGADVEMSDGSITYLTLPPEAGRFMTTFDDGGPVEPFTFAAVVTP